MNGIVCFRYSNTGDSNIFTEGICWVQFRPYWLAFHSLSPTGEIAGHRIVATKVTQPKCHDHLIFQPPPPMVLQLSMIGTDREAATSAGSITTRLLGKYQHVEHVIIVGVAGGQAHLTDPEMVSVRFAFSSFNNAFMNVKAYSTWRCCHFTRGNGRTFDGRTNWGVCLCTQHW